jgi:hypothetical protein
VGQTRDVAGNQQTFTFRSRPTASAFARLDEYVRTRTEGVNHTLFELIRKRDREMGTGDKLPWPTFILGSGCLVAAEPDSTNRAANLDMLIDASFAGFPRELAKRADVYREAVGAFIVELNEGKLGPHASMAWLDERAARLGGKGGDARQRPTVEESTTVDPRFAIRTALVACLATRLYTEALNAVTRVLDRAENDEVAYSLDAHPTMRVVHATVVAPLRTLVRLLRAEWVKGRSASTDAFYALLGAFIEHIDDDDTSRVHRSHVEVLSAFAWYFLTDDTDIYPGWSDTLLFQATDMKDAEEHFTSMPLPRRPQLDDVSPLDETSWLYRRLRRVTRRSWEKDDTERDDFYDSVAALLIAQAGLIRTATSERPKDASWPMASAFIASFDVELEIALLSRTDLPDTGIAIIVPVVQVGEGHDYNTSVHWLARVVHPTRSEATTDVKLANLLDGDGWEEVGAEPRDIERFRGMPTVVHLSGAPLFRLPEAERGFLEEGELRHALLLGENIALVQLGAEIAEHGRSLNPGFAADAPWADDVSRVGPGLRYWFIVGTQVADSSVRLRLLTREIAALRDPGAREQRLRKVRSLSPGAEVTERFGVLVNERVPTSERQVFLWHGFDVTKGTSSEMTPLILALSKDIGQFFAGIPAPVGMAR